MTPDKVILRAWNVGFGDCFLLTFCYGVERRRILIDFGTSAPPPGACANHMLRIAGDIAAHGRLHAVVATHRHRDHISGFGGECGKIIASLAPAVVVQPWTEDPEAPAGCAADEDIQNRTAVENLAAMGRRGRAVYTHAGASSGLEDVLPGVEIHVAGPPTLGQCAGIRRERARDVAEFWQFRRFLESQASGATATELFRCAPRFAPDAVPANLRWFLARAHLIRAEQKKEFVRALDRVLNNSSVILLFKVGDFSMLFPGDAQIENWSWALGQKRYRDLLRGVNVYKVGHHGSFNATPRSLWKLFARRSTKPDAPGRLLSVLSTRCGKHGDERAHTEVPRRTLVEALARESDLFCTQNLPNSTPWRDFEFLLNGGSRDE